MPAFAENILPLTPESDKHNWDLALPVAGYLHPGADIDRRFYFTDERAARQAEEQCDITCSHTSFHVKQAGRPTMESFTGPFCAKGTQYGFSVRPPGTGTRSRVREV